MYKCKECGMEHDIKPDYCDCGNNEFYTVNVSETDINQPESMLIYDDVESLIINEGKNKKTSLDILFAKFSLISVFVFILCIILSLVVILFPIKEKDVTQLDSDSTVSAQKLPSIDKIWNNTPPVVKTENLLPTDESGVQTAVIPNSVRKFQSKATQNSVQKPVVKTVQQNKTVLKQKQTLPVTKSTTTPKQTETELRKTTEETAKKAEELKRQAETLQRTMAEKKEYAAYKIKLRNTIGQRIDFTKVIGDGDCIISFTIDSSGRLINGAFAKQSSNISLNNAVYNAFMSSRNFTPPPAYYKNETLNLDVKLYNGNFEISLN